MSKDFITTGFCGNCDLHEETPIVVSPETDEVGCAICAPASFEQVARRDIDNWLNGGPATPFKRPRE